MDETLETIQDKQKNLVTNINVLSEEEVKVEDLPHDFEDNKVLLPKYEDSHDSDKPASKFDPLPPSFSFNDSNTDIKMDSAN